jgi:hypothetical protein
VLIRELQALCLDVELLKTRPVASLPASDETPGDEPGVSEDTHTGTDAETVPALDEA